MAFQKLVWHIQYEWLRELISIELANASQFSVEGFN